MSKEKETPNVGFMIGEDYYVEFGDGDFIEEDEEGNMVALVNVYQVEKDGDYSKVESLSDELKEKVEVALSTFLTAALEQSLEEGMNTTEDLDKATDIETIEVNEDDKDDL